MTSPAPLSIYEPCCSYCLNKYKEIDSDKQIFFKMNNEIHWACCEKHKKELIDTDKEIYPEKKVNIDDSSKMLLKKLTKMYVELWNEYNKSWLDKLKRAFFWEIKND